MRILHWPTTPLSTCIQYLGLHVNATGVCNSTPSSKPTIKTVYIHPPPLKYTLVRSPPAELPLTGNSAVGVGFREGVVHEEPGGVGLVAAQSITDHHGVHTVVQVGWLVEEQAAVLDGAVVRVGDQLGVGVLVLSEHVSVVPPFNCGCWVTVHGEGETPVVLLLSLSQEQDLYWDCMRGGEGLDLEQKRSFIP